MDENDVGKLYVGRIRHRLHFQNKNWLSIVCGETGSGKSYSALSLGEDIGKVFIVFTSLEFMTLLNSGRLRRGNVIIFDEAGVGMSSREWYSTQNKVLGSVLQTFRNMNVAVIFTTPNLSFVDVQARKLFHAYLETAYLDYEECVSYLKAYDIQVNSRLDKIYYKHPKFTDHDGSVSVMTHFAVHKPSESMIEYYEKLKGDYTKRLNQKALLDLQGGAPKRPKIDEAAIIKDILSKQDKFVKVYANRRFVDWTLVSSEYRVGRDSANRIKKRVEQSIL